MPADLQGRNVLITGGTRGLGLATGLAFGRRGAQCTLTYRWGGFDEDDLQRQFRQVGAPAPFIVEADVSNTDDTRALISQLRDRCERIDAFVSGVSVAQKTSGIDDFKRSSLLRSMEYSVWPTIEYLQEIKKSFESLPRYVVGLSSAGPDQLVPNYDVVATCKAAMEAMFRYLAYRLADDDVRVNVVRTVYVRTDALSSTAGGDFVDFMERTMPELIVPAEPVADAVVALCSGLMDAVSGQVLMVDAGADFTNCSMGLLERHQRLSKQTKGMP